jgi:ubiquinone/menaquinone biosynthesis C-methylase UbiE
MASAQGSIYERLAALADPLRARILLALEGHELTVTELCTVFGLPQSTMSRHLKALADEGWLIYRVEGPSRRYSMPMKRLAADSRAVWAVVREEVAAGAGAEQDRERLGTVLEERRAKRQEFFSAAVQEWDRLRAELVGSRLDALALLGLLDERWRVGDLGCGTGQVAALLAPFVAQVVAVDESVEMLAAARTRLGDLQNVEVREGALEALPLEDGRLDAAVFFLVLGYLGEPLMALREAVRVVRPGGRLLVVDLAPHEREEYRQRLGHLTLGFGEDVMEAWMAEAGVEGYRYTVLPVDRDARGPTLFVAAGRPRIETA